MHQEAQCIGTAPEPHRGKEMFEEKCSAMTMERYNCNSMAFVSSFLEASLRDFVLVALCERGGFFCSFCGSQLFQERQRICPVRSTSLVSNKCETDTGKMSVEQDNKNASSHFEPKPTERKVSHSKHPTFSCSKVSIVFSRSLICMTIPLVGSLFPVQT